MLAKKQNIATSTVAYILDGQMKLISIFHRNNMYGFSEPCQFPSVVQLINYHRKETLKRYNPALDITLKYPASPVSCYGVIAVLLVQKYSLNRKNK